MKFDKETGECLSVSYESYESMKEEYEAEIKKLKQEKEDLQDRVVELEEKLNTKKDSEFVATESKN